MQWRSRLPPKAALPLLLLCASLASVTRDLFPKSINQSNVELRTSNKAAVTCSTFGEHCSPFREHSLVDGLTEVLFNVRCLTFSVFFLKLDSDKRFFFTTFLPWKEPASGYIAARSSLGVFVKSAPPSLTHYLPQLAAMAGGKERQQQLRPWSEAGSSVRRPWYSSIVWGW